MVNIFCMDKLKYSITVDDDKKVIIYQHRGLLSMQEIGEVWNILVQMKEFNTFGYKLLSDYSDADFNFSVHNMDTIWGYFESIKHVLKGKKEAVITTKPLTTAISVLVETETYKFLNFEVKTFSTYEVAMDWLLK
jgi:hypothetical protein